MNLKTNINILKLNLDNPNKINHIKNQVINFK